MLHNDILEDESVLTTDNACDELGFPWNQMVFQHDNDPKHTPNMATKCLSKQVYEVVEWSFQQLDIALIEKI